MAKLQAYVAATIYSCGQVKMSRWLPNYATWVEPICCKSGVQCWNVTPPNHSKVNQTWLCIHFGLIELGECLGLVIGFWRWYGLLIKGIISFLMMFLRPWACGPSRACSWDVKLTHFRPHSSSLVYEFFFFSKDIMRRFFRISILIYI